MDNKDLDKILNEVIIEAQELNIPVPFDINKEIIINSRPKKRLGCCRKLNNVFTIELSSFVLEYDKKRIKEIIAHEVLHTVDSCFNHGPYWKLYAERMNNVYGYNIKRVAIKDDDNCKSTEKRKEYKYVITCKKCGCTFYRMKETKVTRNINKYRCRCGGKLVLKSL